MLDRLFYPKSLLDEGVFERLQKSVVDSEVGTLVVNGRPVVGLFFPSESEAEVVTVLANYRGVSEAVTPDSAETHQRMFMYRAISKIMQILSTSVEGELSIGNRAAVIAAASALALIDARRSIKLLSLI